jgi:non-specific serine/threonine protein kinase
MAGLRRTVPLPLDSFIGRAKELEAVKALLATQRLVTLTGPAGIGKTRLALHLAEELAPAFPEAPGPHHPLRGYPASRVPGPRGAPLAPVSGCCFVPLVELTDPVLVPQAVALALGVREQPDRPLVQALTEHLSSQSVLLVWDNCDYVADGCRALAQALLDACPQVQILATSRRSLRIQGETLYAVPPFSFPAAGSAQTAGTAATELLLAYEAPRLFQDRAGASLTGFTIQPEEAAAVAQICRRLDGIPLAVELAAGRIRELSAAQIAARLDERFPLLTGGASTTTHQQTLRTAIEWSNELLSESERTLLVRLSVFAGGWDLEAAEQICSGGLVSERSVLDLLTGLIDKSLVVGDSAAKGARRYRMLESIREYSRERLRASGEETELLGRCVQFYLKLAEEVDAQFRQSVQETWLDRVENEYENLRTALAWCLTEEGEAETGLQLARALRRFWEVRGYLSEGRALLAQALGRGRGDADQPTRVRAEALNAAAVLAWMQGDAVAARALFDESLPIERALGDTEGVACSLHHLGHVASERGEYETAKGFYQESLALFRELRDQPGIAFSLADQGNVALKQGDLGAARSFYEESLRISRELDHKVSVAIALNNLGKIAREQGDTRAAWALHREGLTIRVELGDKGGYPWSLEAFARLAAPEDPERAARWWGAAEALRESLGLPLPPNEREEYDRKRSAARKALGEEPFATAWAEGRAMTPEQAVADALQEEGPGQAFRRSGVQAFGSSGETLAGLSLPGPERPNAQDHRFAAVPPERLTQLTLLATKLAPPALSPTLLPRPRLTDRLNPIPASGVPVARLALLDASAGSGKSSVVRQWCQEQPVGSVAWLGLDHEDNDPARFLPYLCAAVETVAPAAAAPVRAPLQAGEQTSLEAALILLLNGIAGLEQPITLVLDDYHEIEAEPVHDLVSFLVERLPPTLFLILTTRSDPPLPLARLRLQGRLIEIHDDELRFTDEETGQFLKERRGLTLPPEVVQRLAERTEGWIAGLQMAALSLRSEADAGRFLDAFTGTDRYLVDYFFEEVLRRLPPEVQRFLGKTAFLKRLCAPLCEAVTGMPDGRAMLERLETAHLFLIPMDRERQWYRYHQLFADVLRARLLPEQEEPLAVLQERAAAWYEAEGMVGEAIEHALAGGQFERAARLIEQHGAAETAIARLEALLEMWEKQAPEAGREDRGYPQSGSTVQGRAPGRSGRTMGARVLLAKLHWHAGRREQAITVLQPALALAEREEHPPAHPPSVGTRVPDCFVAAGPELIPALRYAAAKGIAPETVGKLLTKLGTGAQRSTRFAGTQGGAPLAGARPDEVSPRTPLPPVEPLSERELEVLRLVAAGLRNAEIAAQLLLSEGTVHRHIHNLYGKLGVSGRTNAVARARALGLL